MRVLVKILGCGILAATAGVIFVQQDALKNARAENQELSARQAEVDQMLHENAEWEPLNVMNLKVQELKQANAGLPKLRNDIRRAREESAEAASLKMENERLAANNSPTNSDSPPPDFISRASLVDAGFGTPEATVQTFFSAQVRGDILRLQQCCNGTQAGTQNYSQFTAEERVNESRGALKQFAKFPGYRIANKQEITPTEVTIGVQSSIGGAIMPLNLVLKQGEWRISM